MSLPALPLLALVLPGLLHHSVAVVALPPASAPSEGGPLFPVPVPGKSIATELGRAGGGRGPPVGTGGDGVDGASSAPLGGGQYGGTPSSGTRACSSPPPHIHDGDTGGHVLLPVGRPGGPPSPTGVP